MKIQDYSRLVALVAKVEAKRGNYEDLDSALSQIDNVADTDLWLETYDRLQAAKRALKKAYAEFRKELESSEETSFLGAEVSYSYDQSDRNYYCYAKHAILKQAMHVEFEDYRH